MRPWLIRAGRAVAAGVGTWLAVSLGFIVIFENSLIFFPRKGGVGPCPTPGEDVYFTTEDGQRLHAWHATHPAAQVTILWSHGNAGNLEDRREMLLELRNTPANILVYDYRGFGASTGSPDEMGIYRDGRAAYDFLVKTKRVPPERIVLLGKSLGGAVACELATQVKAGGLILQSSFTNAADMSRLIMPGFPARWFIRSKFDNLDKVRRITIPKLFLHAQDDEVIPFLMGPRLFEAAAGPKEHLWLRNGGHNGIYLFAAQEYYPRIAQFVAQVSAIQASR